MLLLLFEWFAITGLLMFFNIAKWEFHTASILPELTPYLYCLKMNFLQFGVHSYKMMLYSLGLAVWALSNSYLQIWPDASGAEDLFAFDAYQRLFVGEAHAKIAYMIFHYALVLLHNVKLPVRTPILQEELGKPVKGYFHIDNGYRILWYYSK